MIFCAFLLQGCAPKAVDFEQMSPKEKVVLTFSHVVSDASPKGRAARLWADLVYQRSGGRIEMKIYPNGTLYKDGEELEALKKGYVQIIAPATSKLTGLDSRWGVFDLPFFFNDLEQVHQLADGPVGELLRKSMREKGIEVLAYWDNGFKILTADRPLENLKDFQGLKIRIMDSPILKMQFLKLGAIPVPLSFNEVFEALENKKVNGSENTPSNLYSKKFYQLQSYVTVSNHGYLGYAVLMNRDYFNSLDQETRKILLETLKEVTAWQRKIALEQNAEDLARIRNDQNIKIHDLTPEEKEAWQAVLKPLAYEIIPLFPKDLQAEILKTGNLIRESRVKEKE